MNGKALQPIQQQLKGRYLVLFDGECNLCNASVDFIVRKDPKGRFAFASLQSEVGQQVLQSFGLTTDDFYSVALLKSGQLYFRSAAALQIAAGLKGGWPLLKAFMVVPRIVRDGVYNIISKNRYRWFGKRETCRLPSPEERGRFLG